MADPVVSFVRDRIGKLLDEEGRFLAGVEDQVKLLEGELKLMQANLRDAEEKNIENQVVRVWISDAKDIAYDVEDLVEKYAFRFGSSWGGGFVKFLSRCAPLLIGCFDRHNIGVEIQPLNKRISALKQHFLDYGIQGKMEKEGSSSVQQQLRRTYSFIQEEDFVGLHNDVDMLVEHLVSQHDRVVSITGMGGLGKTTIANKVYNHPAVKRHFNGLAWICVSQQWQTSEILQKILIKLLPEKEDDIKTKWKDEDELLRNLLQVLQEKRCLIVLDDIWTENAWNCIKAAFPNGKDSCSKILVTTRNKEVALCIGPDGFHHEPRLLDNEESWMLLRGKCIRERFYEGPGHHMNEFETLGKQMVEHCAGLPLAVIVLGGILLTKPTLNEWKMVRENIKSYLWNGKSLEKGAVKRILDLSYYDLPYHLKSCFLYLALFPEDTDIDADTVYQLWMAEGMVLNGGVGKESMMELAEHYLSELGQRSIVQLKIIELPGMRRRCESCRLHDLMRELCLVEAEQDGFLTCIDQTKGTDPFSSLYASSTYKHRRLAINFVNEDDASRYIPLKRDITKCLRTFQYHGYGRQPIALMVASQLKNFERLRVLRIEGCGGFWYGNIKLTKEIGKLFNLRYLSLRYLVCTELPSSLGNLKNLQTLNLLLYGHVRLPNSLRNMEGLISLYLPLQLQPKHKIRLDALLRLEILENFDDEYCETSDLFKLTNLRVLQGRCKSLENLRMMVDYTHINTRLEHVSIDTSCDFTTDREEGLTVLKHLLLGRNIHLLESYGSMWKFPKFESNMASCLVRLQIWGSGLDAEEMCKTIQEFPHLVQLLVYGAEGKELCFSAKGFPKLEMLRFLDFIELEKWVVEEGAMPNLQSLTIQGPALKSLPDGLCWLKNLKYLTLCPSMKKEFEEKIRRPDGEDFYKISHVPFVNFGLDNLLL